MRIKEYLTMKSLTTLRIRKRPCNKRVKKYIRNN